MKLKLGVLTVVTLSLTATTFVLTAAGAPARVAKGAKTMGSCYPHNEFTIDTAINPFDADSKGKCTGVFNGTISSSTGRPATRAWISRGTARVRVAATTPATVPARAMAAPTCRTA